MGDNAAKVRICPNCDGGSIRVEFRDVFGIDPQNPPPPTHYGMWLVCQSCGHQFQQEDKSDVI